jgi:histidyl-tRNA synthetase
VDLPALGFGMGDVVLGELLRARGLMTPRRTVADCYVAAEYPVTDDAVIGIVTALRRAGLAVEYAFSRGPLGRQRKAAWSAQVSYLVDVRQTDEGLRLQVRDGAGAGLISAVTNVRTLGDVVGEAPLGLDDLLTVIKANPRSVRPDFAFRAGS